MPTTLRAKKPAPIIIPVPKSEIAVPKATSPKLILPATGNITTAPAWNPAQPYGIPWNRFTAEVKSSIERYAAERQIDPYVPAMMTVVESSVRQFDDRGRVIESADDGHGGGTAKGIMQVKNEVHRALLDRLQADWRTVDGNIEAGIAILADAWKRLGSWQAAIATYHPGRDPHSGATPETYVKTIEALLVEAKAGSAPIDDPWRPYPYPPMRKDAHVRKPGEGAGFDRVAPRGPRIVGSCNHITDGVPGGDQVIWYRDFFSTGGERAWDALTDTVIADNGDIGLLNDWRDPDWGGRRAGWANGGANGLEDDGVAFYRNYPDINSVLVSKEHVTRTGRPITTACLDASIELSTAVAQEVKCPWDTYPYHPGKNGVNIEQQHRNFATKSCPAEPFIGTTYPKLVAAVRAKLKSWQGGEPSTPQPEPVDTFTRWGMTAEHLAWFFGEMTRVNDDGSTEQLPFSPTGPLSLLWMARCERDGVFPEADYLQSWDSDVAEGKEWYATWRNGWVAYLPIDNQRAGWKWLDEKEAA